MFTRARSMFTMALTVAFTVAVLVPSTSEAKYRKHSLPAACKDPTTVEPFWKDKKLGEEPLFFLAMAALDPTVAGETPVAVAKWASLCDKSREAYLVWFESVVRTGIYLVLDYRFSGPQIFGGESYPDADGDSEELEAMPLDEIADLLLQPPILLDVVAAGRPGTPHSSGTLGGFTANICAMTGVGCPKKAPPAKAKVGSAASSGGSSGTKPADATACPDGTPKPCPSPADAPPAP